ncbi:MAG TPA: hypothetical protein VFR58_16005 [Flavisolibacter sp.]|nr:hypothetical protein [Flavisolibacter sp.]
METFFQYFEKRTGRPPTEAQQVIKITSGYLAKHYKKEFAIIIQYFLTYTFDQKKPGSDENSLQWFLENQNAQL